MELGNKHKGGRCWERLISVPGVIFICLLMPLMVQAQGGPHVLFGSEQLVRTSGSPDVFQRSFSVPTFVGEPFSLRIVNGNPDGSKRVEDAISSGRVQIDGVEVVSPNDFNQTTANIDKMLTALAVGDHTLEVEIGSSPGSFITLTIEAELIDITPPVVTPPTDSFDVMKSLSPGKPNRLSSQKTGAGHIL